ncbi:MAG: hypothetical protein AB7V74_26850, partial [Acidimicrobiia bacterium]
RNELGALVQAGLGDLRDGGLITLLALNGLRISEALNADIDDLCPWPCQSPRWWPGKVLAVVSR